jgi:hypothetical protein
MHGHMNVKFVCGLLVTLLSCVHIVTGVQRVDGQPGSWNMNPSMGTGSLFSIPLEPI